MEKKTLTGKRKFAYSIIFAIIIVVISWILNLKGYKITDNYINTVIMLYLGYLTANIFSKAATGQYNEDKATLNALPGKKKFFFSIIMGVIILGLSTSLMFLQKDIQDGFYKICFYVYGGYLFGNTIDKYINLLGKFKLPIPILKNKKEELINETKE